MEHIHEFESQMAPGTPDQCECGAYKISDRQKKFLDKLRDSGKTNMFGAAPYIQSEFGLDKKEARDILSQWMKSFD